MDKQTMICRVCGKEYEACNSVRTGNGTFNWREVACSPECGTKYFELVAASRSAKAESVAAKKVASKKKVVREPERDSAEPSMEETV